MTSHNNISGGTYEPTGKNVNMQKCRFSNDKLTVYVFYSYTTPILLASYNDDDDKLFLVLNNNHYSKTTERHKAKAIEYVNKYILPITGNISAVNEHLFTVMLLNELHWMSAPQS